MSKSGSNLSLLKRFEIQKKISLELIEFGYFIHSKEPNLAKIGFLACLACMKAFTEGRTAIDNDYFQEFLHKLKLGDVNYDVINERLCNESIIGKPGELNLFIFEHGLLYLYSFYEYEQELVTWLLEKAKKVHTLEDSQQRIVDEKYPQNLLDEDLQKSAVLLSLIKPLVFLTGGPGTGKTYTVNKIIEIHRLLYGTDYTIRLAAPTGKAAQRINDSLSGLIEDSNKAETIHRLLGAKKGFDSFKYSKENPLNLDLLIIDEASMMDISLWIALINALPDNAKLIIVGDNNQLASVEAGAVLNDICKPADNTFSAAIASKIGLKSISSLNSDLNDCIITLQKSKRFGSQTGIQALAEAIRIEDAEQALAILEDETIEDVSLIENNSENREFVVNKYAITPYFDMDNHDAMDKTTILCALKNGEVGSIRLNRKIEDRVKEGLKVSKSEEWYPDRKIIVNRNQHLLNVQNGETGYFNSESDSIHFSMNSVQVSRLQYIEPGYCITIHKSQGSEYKHVALVLPEQENRVLTKELLYTGVTRAGLSVLVVGDTQLFKQTIKSPTTRKSGLKQKLWH